MQSIEPEIIDVTPRSKPLRPRKLPMVFSLIKAMIMASLPAFGAIWCTIKLIQILATGELWASIPLVLLTPFTLVLTMIALPVDLFLGLSLLALIFGKTAVAVNFSSRAGDFRGARTVYPNTRPVNGPGFEQIEN